MKSDRTQRGPKGFILLEPGNIMQILPEDNKSWLTLFYSLPEELVSKRPAYMNLPRCPFDVIRSDDYAELLNTDVFLELVWDCYAWSAWQCFEVPNKDGDYREIPGSFNSYSGDFPLWRLSYTIIPYIREKFEHIGLSFQSLFNMPRGMEVPFLTYQQFSNLIGSVVPMIVKEQNWQPIIDTIWATRDETDYVFRNSLVKKEFMRKWSHSRTSVGAMLALDQLMEDTPDSITAESAPFEEEIIESQTFEAFVATLSERDQQILQFKSEGFTLKEIAAKVGYQNHSAVSKRIHHISEKYSEYRNQ